MDDWTERLLSTPVSGIECRHWVDFLKAFTEAADPEWLKQRIENALRQRASGLSDPTASAVVEGLFEVHRLLSGEAPQE